jgi:hypothetical protein
MEKAGSRGFKSSRARFYQGNSVLPANKSNTTKACKTSDKNKEIHNIIKSELSKNKDIDVRRVPIYHDLF